MYNEDEINLITLCSFFQLTYNQRKQLLSGLENSRPDFVKYEKNLIKTLPAGVYNKVKADFYDVNYRNKVLESLKIKGVTCVTYFSEDYPQALKNTALPPIVLYCKGNLKLLKERCFAVVGSRRTLPDITAKTKKIAKELSEKFVVVTGMADGADAAVCEGGAQNCRIISVLAYGFDHVYPAVNANLIKTVEKRGLLLSEYPPEIPPQRHNFPIRNRIIAGLSEGTLIVSAGKKSGALITAEYSEEYGRETFAFPYGIGVTSGEGCNHIDDRIGLHQLLRLHQSRYAGLHSRLVCACDTVKEYQGGGQQRHQVDRLQEQGNGDDEGGGEKVQQNHDIPLVEAVGCDAAHRREEDGGDKGAGCDQAVQPGGAGLIEQVQGQGEPQGGVAEERYDLTNGHQGKIPAEQFLLHSDVPPFYHTVQRYVFNSNKSALQPGQKFICAPQTARPAPAGAPASRHPRYPDQNPA